MSIAPKPPRGFLTICTLSYVPTALVTVRSANRHSAQYTYFIFVVDAPAETIQSLTQYFSTYAPWLNVFGPADLGDLAGSYLQTFRYYNRFEVCNVAKYIGVLYVLSKGGCDVCIFADADTYFVADVEQAINEIDGAAILLTPHQHGFTNDANESEYLLHGWLNSGFSVFNGHHVDAPKALNWLIDRISRRGFLAPQYGLSGDQPWISGVPFFFPNSTRISLHSGLNVAYWNIDERTLVEENGQILSNRQALIFFHFSGFVGAPAGQLSKHPSGSIQPGSVLERLCMAYRAEFEKEIELFGSLVELPTIAATKANLAERIYTVSQLYGISIESPTLERGIFTRVGMRLDAMFRRWKR